MSDPSAPSYTVLNPQPFQSIQPREYLFTDNACFSVLLDTRREEWHSDIKPGHTTHTLSKEEWHSNIKLDHTTQTLSSIYAPAYGRPHSCLSFRTFSDELVLLSYTTHSVIRAFCQSLHMLK
jgi:hypothetical protein